MSAPGVSTSQVETKLGLLKERGLGALIGYLPAGFPDLQTSIEAAVALAESGVDIIELGLPYSDPVMDGPVIQEATVAALSNGFKIADGLRAVKEITARVDVPVLVMTYWNPVLQFGVTEFAGELKKAGGAGLITPDLIPDEAAQWLEVSEKFQLDRVFLAAPSSSSVRLERTTELSRGFVYAVSTMGVTGARTDVDSAARGLVQRLRVAGCEFTCVGLGISQPEHVTEVLTYADGAIVGSAFVRALARGGISELRELATSLAAAAHAERPVDSD